MTYSTAEIVGRNVRAEMVRRGLTQLEFAAQVNIAQPGLSKRLRGIIAFDVEELTRCAEPLDVPLVTLMPPVPVAS